MPSHCRRSDLHEHVLAIMDETGADDPYEAVRIKARAVVAEFGSAFGEQPPFHVTAMASFRGLHLSDDDPRFSPDSEIAPEGDGRVVLRVNKNRPEARQRFSICHEIGHTLFPEYDREVRCRKRPDRSFADADDMLESLCDAAASELMFPDPWFADAVASMTLSAPSISQLSSDYKASREATVRRVVEVSPSPLAAVFFSWKLKPTQVRELKRKAATKPLFDELESDAPQPMLRVDYSIANAAFQRQVSGHIPKDKSIPDSGPIHLASTTQSLHSGVDDIDLGTLAGRFRVHALPVYTAAEAVGPGDAASVVAILEPLA